MTGLRDNVTALDLQEALHRLTKRAVLVDLLLSEAAVRAAAEAACKAREGEPVTLEAAKEMIEAAIRVASMGSELRDHGHVDTESRRRDSG